MDSIDAPTCAEIAANDNARLKAAPGRRLAEHNNALNEELFNAMGNGTDIERIKQLLLSGADPNYQRPYDDPVLVAALNSAHPAETVVLLLSYKANPNTKSRYGSHVLSLAVNFHPSDKIIRDLLQRGANPNAGLDGKSNSYPLLLAADCACGPVAASIVRLLLKAGANPRVTTMREESALDLAEHRLRDSRSAADRKVYEDVIAALQEPVQPLSTIRPSSPDAHLSLGNALMDKSDVNGAIAEYQAALGLDPNYANAHNGLGYALMNKGDVNGAVVEFQTALRLTPNDVYALNYLAWLYATANNTLRNPAKALEYALRTVALDNARNAGHLATLAEAYFANRDYENAALTEKRALALQPEVSLRKRLEYDLARYEQAKQTAR